LQAKNEAALKQLKSDMEIEISSYQNEIHNLKEIIEEKEAQILHSQGDKERLAQMLQKLNDENKEIRQMLMFRQQQDYKKLEDRSQQTDIEKQPSPRVPLVDHEPKIRATNEQDLVTKLEKALAEIDQRTSSSTRNREKHIEVLTDKLNLSLEALEAYKKMASDLKKNLRIKDEGLHQLREQVAKLKKKQHELSKKMKIDTETEDDNDTSDTDFQVVFPRRDHTKVHQEESKKKEIPKPEKLINRLQNPKSSPSSQQASKRIDKHNGYPIGNSKAPSSPSKLQQPFKQVETIHSADVWTDVDVEDLPERYSEVHYKLIKKAQFQDIVDRLKNEKILELETKLTKLKSEEGKVLAIFLYKLSLESKRKL
jgi:hypothetical protein